MPNGAPWPRIRLVTPSYNQGWAIETTIRSVLLQGYPNLEYVVMDGGSTDETVAILRRYDAHLSGWVSEPDGGQSHAINKGLQDGAGAIFAWLNSDDRLLPGALEQVAYAYGRAPEAVGWVGACELVDRNGRYLKTVIPKGLQRDQLADWFYGGYIFQPACFFAAAAFRQIGGLDESLHYVMDFDLWLRLAALGDFAPIAASLAAAIIHDEAKSQAARLDMHAETMAVQINNGYRKLAVKRLERLLAATATRQQKESRPAFRLKRNLRRLLNESRRYASGWGS
jgi:glycosyltransferase involved in cell wall biosynthesis